MTATASIQLALRTIRRSPLKAALTGLGLLLGVLAITLTVASGEGARRAVEQQWKAMVGNLDALFVSPGGPAQRGMATMENSNASLMRHSMERAVAVGLSLVLEKVMLRSAVW